MFDREKSDALFTDTLDFLDVLNTRDGRFEYADYVAMHNNITALYDSFSEVEDLIKSNERLAISMCAGARAIETNINRMAKRCVYDVQKLEPTISYLEAARILREAAEKVTGGGE